MPNVDANVISFQCPNCDQDPEHIVKNAMQSASLFGRMLAKVSAGRVAASPAECRCRNNPQLASFRTKHSASCVGVTEENRRLPASSKFSTTEDTSAVRRGSSEGGRQGCSARAGAKQFSTPLMEVCCFQVAKRFGTCFRNCRIGLFASGHYCPAALLDESPAIPSVADFVQLGEICGCVRRLPELVDADRFKSSNYSHLGLLLCDFFNGASERPSAPTEADNHRDGSAGHCALQKTCDRISTQD
jgi:hypothetical protein